MGKGAADQTVASAWAPRGPAIGTRQPAHGPADRRRRRRRAARHRAAGCQFEPHLAAAPCCPAEMPEPLLDDNEDRFVLFPIK